MLARCYATLSFLLVLTQEARASSWATFSNSNCTTSIAAYPGQNGYPDGVCTDIPDTVNGTYAGFMFTVLDDGCVPTIYQADTNEWTCSGAIKEAEIGVCYNTSWQYYSVDGCTSPSSSSSSATSAASAILTSTTSLSSGSATIVYTTAAASSSSSSTISGGDIAGAIVGSICGLGLIAAVCVYLFWFRPRQQAVKRERQHAIEHSGLWRDKGNTSLQNLQQAKRPERYHTAAEMATPVDVAELADHGPQELPSSNDGIHKSWADANALELPGDHAFSRDENVNQK